jgi:hypothetical protein
MLRILSALLVSISLLGCGPAARDTGKNKDLDRPKAAEPGK